MTPQMWLENLAAYSLQVAVIILAGTALVYLFRLRAPNVLLAFWQSLLVICLLLPAFQPWRQQMRTTPLSIFEDSLAPAVPAPDLAPSAAIRETARTAPFPFSAALGLILGAGAALRFLWLALGLLRLHIYRNKSRRLSALPDSIRDMQWRVGVAPEIYLSPEIDSPVTFGWRKPAVLFPASFLEMSESLQRPIACHELLHVERRDWLNIVIEDVLRSLLWFHPAIWWAVGRIHLSREQVVDREVLRVTGERGPYLESLLHIASLRGRPAAVPAPLLLKERHLVQRVALMLKESTMTRSRLIFSLTAITGLLLWTGTYAAAWFPLITPAAPAPVTAPARDSGTLPTAKAQEPMRVGADVQASKLIRKVDPLYPEVAKNARVSGIVLLEVDVNEAGIVSNLRIIRGHPLLDQAAMDAVRQWRYSPTLINGAAIPVRTTVAVTFTLSETGAATASAAKFVKPAEVPAQVSGVEPRRVGGNVQDAKLIRKVDPVYPELARRAKVSGIVMLEANINEAGEVTSVRIIRGHPLLDQAAVEAVKQWRYEPTYVNGVAVPVVATQTVIFKLGADSAVTRLKVDASGNVKVIEADAQGYLREIEGPVPFDKIKEAGGTAQVAVDAQVPFAVLQQTMSMLQSQGIQTLQFAGGSPYVYKMGRLFYVAPPIGYQVTTQTLGADPAVQAPQLGIDLDQLAAMAKASGGWNLQPGTSGVLFYTVFVNEVGEILAVQSGSSRIENPEIATALSQAKVIAPGRRGNQPVPTAVTIYLTVK